MAEVIDRGSLFYFDELKILLYACGYRKVQGILLPEKTYSKDDIVQVLYHLSEMGVIEAHDEKFRIMDRYREMLEIIGEPEYVTVWKPGDEEDIVQKFPEFFCYFKEKRAVVSERYWRRKDTVKIRMFSLDEFEVWKEKVKNDYSGY